MSKCSDAPYRTQPVEIKKYGNALDNVIIVLVKPRNLGNIGSCVRAAYSMGITDIRVVSPYRYDVNEIKRMAAGAANLVDSIICYETTKDACADASFVIATSARQYKDITIKTPQRFAQDYFSIIESNKIALLFGNEKNGLGKDDINLSHLMVRIPASKHYHTLNLAQSVMVLVYELFKQVTIVEAPNQSQESLPYQEVEKILSRGSDFLVNVGAVKDNDIERMIRHIRYLLGRSGVTPREGQILNGILYGLEKSSLRDKEEA